MPKPKSIDEALDIILDSPRVLVNNNIFLQNEYILKKDNRTPVILMDMSCIGYMMFFARCSMGKCREEDVQDIMVYSLLLQILNYATLLKSYRIILVWDSRHSTRKEVYQAYKSARRHVARPPEEVARMFAMKQALALFRKKIVPLLGFNSVVKRGYEADDLIAVFAKAHPNTKFIALCNDEDIYQLLNRSFSVFNPRQHALATPIEFITHYGYQPKYIIVKKAVAGCVSDSVKGVPGIGDKRCYEFIKRSISSKYEKLIYANWKTVLRNKKLVTLPYQGTPLPKIHDFNFDASGFKKVCTAYGLTTLRNRIDEYKEAFTQH